MEPDSSVGRAPQLGDYAAVLRARKWLVISITLLALVGAGTYLAVRTPVYSSSAEIQIFATDEGLGTSVDLETEARIASSLSVAALAIPKLGGTFGSAEGLLEHVSVTLPSDAAILMITFTHTDRGVAVDGAKAISDSYLEFKASQISQEVESQKASLESQQKTLETEAAQLTRIIDTTTSETERATAQTKLSTVQLSLGDIQQQLFTLENDQPPTGQPLGPPSTAKLASPGVPLVLIGAGFLGLFLGAILAFVIEGLTGRVREAEEVEEELGAAVLGMVPVMHLKRTRGRVPVVSRDTPSEPAAEAYRLLRSGFLYAAGSDERIVMVTSPGVGDGKSTTAANLAVALAQAGHRTILVGGDLRRSDLHTLFGVPNDTGLVHVLEGRSTPAPLPTDVENLRIIPSGPPTEISAHLFETEAFPEALATLREQAEYIVVDAPPLAISDPLLMVPSVDYVIFVVDANKATRRALRRTRELLARIGLPRMGVVLNRSKSPWGPSGTRAYYYYKKGRATDVAAAEQEAAKEPARIAASETAAAESKPEAKPVEVKAESKREAKPVEAKAVEAKPESTPAETKPVGSKFVESTLLETKPVEAAPAETKTADAKPVEVKPADAKPAEAKPAEAKPVEVKPVEVKPVEVKAADAKPAEAKPVEVKPTEAKPAEVKAESAPDKARPDAAKTEPPAAVPSAAPAVPAKTPASPAAPEAPVPSSAAPTAQAAPPEVKAEPAATTTAAAPTPAPPVPVETPTPVPPVPAPAAGPPAPPAPVTPPAPQPPSVPGPSGEASEPAIEPMPEPVVEPSSRNGGRTSKRSGSRKRRSGSRGRSRPSGG